MDRHSLDDSSTPEPEPSCSPQKARSRSKSLATLPPHTSLNPERSDKNMSAVSALPPVLRRIPRPPNAFILYRSSKMRELKEKRSQPDVGTGLDKLDYQRKLSGIIGELWRNETDDIKNIFYQKAKQAAKEHAERYPEYRFKPATSSKKSAPRTANSPAATPTPEKQADTDFSPGDRSGPVSGSGSGSGRQRASLDGARSRTSPYSASPHRRASSGGPSSPTARKSSHVQTQQTEPVLLTAAPQPGVVYIGKQPVTRSVSYGATGHQRSTRSSARRSLDGHSSQVADLSFNTLVPQHLRDHARIFLAPPPPPPIPVGLAITTDDAAAASEARGEEQSRPQPKVSLSEAVRRALPPEQRAILHASLAKKGLFVTDDPTPSSTSSQRGVKTPSLTTSDGTTPALAQSESWTSLTSSVTDLDSQQVWSGHGCTEPSSTQASWQASQNIELASALDPANHASLKGSSHVDSNANIHTHSGLADWSQPNPCWLNYAQSQSASSPSSAPPPSTSQISMEGSTTPYSPTLRQGPESQHIASAVPSYSFATIDAAQFSDMGYPINSANSAVMALCDPDDSGDVQGHLYSLDGNLVGQGVVDGGGEPGAYNENQYTNEVARQNRALEQLLMQIMEATSQPSTEFQRPLRPVFDYSAATFPPSGPEPPQAYPEAVSQWSSWPQGFLSTPGASANGGIEPPGAVHGLSAAFDDESAYSQPSSMWSYSLSQEWSLTQVEDQHARVVSPPPMSGAGTNFSRPMQYTSQAQEQAEAGTETSALSPTQPDSVQVKREEPSAPDQATGLFADHLSPIENDIDQPRSNKLRSHLASIKEKLSRVKHRATPSTSSVSALSAPSNANVRGGQDD